MPFIYKDVKQEIGYRLDLLVENKVIVEIKAVENLAPVHFAQLLIYLKLSGKKRGLLINFNSKVLKNDIHRVVKRYKYNLSTHYINLFPRNRHKEYCMGLQINHNNACISSTECFT